MSSKIEDISRKLKVQITKVKNEKKIRKGEDMPEARGSRVPNWDLDHL
jgi:hypothetical protein